MADFWRRRGCTWKGMMAEIIQGSVERITFTNEENGYSVIKVKVPGRRDLVSVVGNFVSVTPGEVLRMEGSWGVHARFGEQFKVDRYETAAPDSVQGIGKYLGPGSSKASARSWPSGSSADLGRRPSRLSTSSPERLREVEGIGAYRLDQIRKAWEDQKDIRELMIFLRSHGVSAAFATRIFKHYGKAPSKWSGKIPIAWPWMSPGSAFLPPTRLPNAWVFRWIRRCGRKAA